MKKLLLIVFIVLGVIIAALALAPILFKDKIVAKIKTTINQNVNAKVNFGNFGLTLLSSFPNLTICINDLSVIGVSEFKGDTLTYIKTLEATVDLMSAVKGDEINVRAVHLDDALINLLVLKDGKANWDISKPSPPSGPETSSNYRISLKKYSVDKSDIRYDDQSAGLKMILQGVNHSGSGDFTQDLFTLVTKTTIDKTTVWYGAIPYLANVKTALKADLEMDMKNRKYTFRDNELNLNDLILGFDGFVAMPTDDIVMDIKFKSRKTDFGSLVSLIPGIYQSNFKDLKSSGTVAFEGFVKGTYNDKTIPAYGLTLVVQNGMFKYPSLPTPVNNVQVDLKVSNPDGITDHTIINLKRLHVEMGAEPFDAHLYVSTPISDANIDGAANGKINLANIKDIVPLEKGTDLSGLLVADLAAKGRMSSIEKKQYENFNARGSLAVTGMVYKSETYPKGIAINQLGLTFNPANVNLTNCEVRMGNSDIKASGTLENFLAYYLKDQTLKGSINLYSNTIDLNELMTSSSSSAAPDTSTMTVIEVPANIDFTLNSTVSKLLYEDITIQNLKGTVVMRDQAVQLNGISFNTMDGLAKMSGSYSTKEIKRPAINFNLSLVNFDIPKTFKTFNTVQKMAPIAERCIGKFSSDFVVTGNLDQHMQPVLSSLTGDGRLKTGNVSVTNFQPLSEMADALKMPQYKQVAVKNVDLYFAFKNGRVNVKPFETDISGIKTKVEGSNGFDQTIDYKVDLAIPRSKLPPQAVSVVNNLFASANKAAGTNITLPDPVNVKVFIGGTITKPVIKTGLNDAAMNLAETATEQVKEVVQEKVDEAKAEAKKQADKLISDAEAKAKQLHDAAVVAADKAKKEGYAAADKLVAQAKDPIAKTAAKIASDKLKKETDAKVAQIIKAADDEGKKIIDEARKQADALLK